jgi:hypothetical protein
VWEFAAQLLSDLTGMSASDILADFMSETFCDAYTAALKPQIVKVTEKSRPVELAKDGYPVSSNPVWNLCVRGKATLEDIKGNTDGSRDRVTGKFTPKSCDAYKHTGSNGWSYPDDAFLTINIIPRKANSPVVSVPKGYVVVPFTQWTANVK